MQVLLNFVDELPDALTSRRVLEREGNIQLSRLVRPNDERFWYCQLIPASIPTLLTCVLVLFGHLRVEEQLILEETSWTFCIIPWPAVRLRFLCLHDKERDIVVMVIHSFAVPRSPVEPSLIAELVHLQSQSRAMRTTYLDALPRRLIVLR